MAWDIHGNRLEPGYCEVHPWVPQSYPCDICMRDIERDSRQRLAKFSQQRKETEEMNRRMDEDYFRHTSFAFWFLTRVRDFLKKHLDAINLKREDQFNRLKNEKERSKNRDARNHVGDQKPGG